jgi:hypothetical protein
VSILSNDFFVLILYIVGDVYEGEYVNEKKHGKGKYTSANGDVYEGDFVEGKKCGQGVFTYSSGNVYSGEYKDGKQNGQVLLTPLLIHSFTDVPPRLTQHINALFLVVQGTYTYASGNVYVGQYENGKMHGKVSISPTACCMGIFNKQTCMCDAICLVMCDGTQGVYTYASGNVYDGEWKKGKKEGFGVYTTTNGKNHNTPQSLLNKIIIRVGVECIYCSVMLCSRCKGTVVVGTVNLTV